MTQSTPQVITTQMINAFDINRTEKNKDLNKELIPPSSIDASVIRNIDALLFDFKTSITPSTHRFSYLVVLCPQLKYGFLKMLYDLPEWDSLYKGTVSISIPTIRCPSSTALTVSFVAAENLDPKDTASQEFLDLLIPGDYNQEITEEMLRDKTGVFEIGSGENQVDLDWFSNFGEKTALLRPLTQQSWVDSLSVLIGKKEKMLILNQQKNTVQTELGFVFVKRYSIQKSLYFNILGGFLIQGSVASEHDLESIDLQWQYTIDVSNLLLHRSDSIPVTIGRVGETTDTATKQAICILIEPFELDKKQSFTFLETKFEYQGIMNINLKVTAIEQSQTSSLGTGCKFYQVETPFSTPSNLDSISVFLTNQGYMTGTRQEVSANAFMQSANTTDAQETITIEEYDTPQRIDNLSIPFQNWKLSYDTQSTPSLGSISTVKDIILPDPFVPSKGTTWSLAIPLILDVEFTPTFNGQLTMDQTVTFHCDYDIPIKVRNL